MNGLRRHYVDCRIGQLHVTTDDGPNTGHPLIMMNSRSRTLLPLLSRLRPHFRGIVIDIPGFGFSSPPPPGASMPDIGDCIGDLFDAWKLPKAPVFGFHTGHKILTAFAARHPNRVDRLIVAGKTHSILPDREARNRSMQAYIARRTPDFLLVALEGKFIDDPTQGSGNEAIYNANFAFDFGGALASVRAPTLVIEVCTEEEDRDFGRQGDKLVAPMSKGRTVALPQTERAGIDLYVGFDTMATTILSFLTETID